MTKDEIFAAMEKAYTGAGSTVEGSFAGDLLRACAERRGRKAPHRRGREGVRGGRKAAEHRRKRRSERGCEPRRSRKRI